MVGIIRIDTVTGIISQITHPGHKLKSTEKRKKLYHYTSFDTFLKIYYGNRLKYGTTIKVNDILEANKRILAENPCHLPLLFALRDTLASYKQISFTMDYDTLIKGFMSNSMWHHYGDKRNGVCIEFDFDKLIFPTKAKHGQIKYKYLLHDNIVLPKNIKTIKEVERFVRKNIKKLFFIKTNEWKYENEYKIVCPDEEYLDITGAITAIYFTNCDSEMVKVAEKIVNNAFPIRYIDFMSEHGDITPVDYDTKSMRMKYETISEKNKDKKSFFQEAFEFYENNKNEKDKTLVMC